MPIEIKHRISGTVLKKVDADTLAGADLRGADLRDANLWGVNLGGADLRNADLRGASLYGTNLRNADLRGANLYGTNLYGANLGDANLYGANLGGANGVKCLGTDRRGYRFIAVCHNDGWRILAGCRWFTINEAVKHWTKKGNKDALARVAVATAED